MKELLPIGTRVKILDKTEGDKLYQSPVYREYQEGKPVYIAKHKSRMGIRCYVVDIVYKSDTGDHFAYTDVVPWNNLEENAEEL